MTCSLPAEDCALIHWAPVLDARRERSGWRAPCPACHAERAIEFDVPGRSVRWKSFCPCEKQQLRETLALLLPGCLPARRVRSPLSHDAVTGLALDRSLPPMTLRLRLLELAGMSTPDALDKLGVRPDNRRRVISGRSGAASKWTRNRMSPPVAPLVQMDASDMTTTRPNGRVTADRSHR